MYEPLTTVAIRCRRNAVTLYSQKFTEKTLMHLNTPENEHEYYYMQDHFKENSVQNVTLNIQVDNFEHPTHCKIKCSFESGDTSYVYDLVAGKKFLDEFPNNSLENTKKCEISQWYKVPERYRLKTIPDSYSRDENRYEFYQGYTVILSITLEPELPINALFKDLTL